MMLKAASLLVDREVWLPWWRPLNIDCKSKAEHQGVRLAHIFTSQSHSRTALANFSHSASKQYCLVSCWILKWEECGQPHTG